MSDEIWLRELAQMKRDQEAEAGNRLDERWDRLSAGELSPEEEAELKALAETSGEAREAYEAFRPLGPEFHASVVQAIREQGLAPAESKALEPPAKLLPFRRRARFWTGWSAAAAAAAALFFFLRNPASPPLPAYSMEVSGGISAMRGEQDEVEVFAPGDRCKVVLRPDRSIAQAEPLAAHSLLAQAGDLHRLETTREKLDRGGAVMMEVLIDQDVQPGDWTLLAVVGRQGKLPEPAELQRFSGHGQVRQRDWVAVSKEIKIQNRDLPP